jgi:hypothetical protein
LHGCETWSLTLREEYRLRVFENRVLRRIYGAKRDQVAGDWRKLHNEELHNLYSSPNIIRMIKSGRMRWPGYAACMRHKMNACRILVWKPEGKRPLGRRRWEDNIKMDAKEMGWSYWIDLASGCVIGDFSRRADPHAVSQRKVKLSLRLIN